MTIKFPKVPICEKCGDNPANTFCYFPDDKSWKFCCDCADEYTVYHIVLDRLFSSPASTVDWFAHINDKSWMDWKCFMEMIDRFRDATNSYNQV